MTLLAWPDFTGLHCNMLRGQNSTKFGQDIGLSSMPLKFKCYLVSKRGSRKGDCGRKSRPNFILFHPPPVKLCKNLRGILWCTMGLAIKAQTYWRDVGGDLQVAMLRSWHRFKLQPCLYVLPIMVNKDNDRANKYELQTTSLTVSFVSTHSLMSLFLTALSARSTRSVFWWWVFTHSAISSATVVMFWRLRLDCILYELLRRNEEMNEWMNEWVNEWMNEW